jgi:hypothetical protein
MDCVPEPLRGDRKYYDRYAPNDLLAREIGPDGRHVGREDMIFEESGVLLMALAS